MLKPVGEKQMIWGHLFRQSFRRDGPHRIDQNGYESYCVYNDKTECSFSDGTGTSIYAIIYPDGRVKITKDVHEEIYP